jgi:hypothetical protein
MHLKEKFLSLTPAERRQVHFSLCRKALAVWSDWSSQKKRLQYVDGVVGLSHNVDFALPSDAFSAAARGRDASNVAKRYLEPITAMQDVDLELPREITFAYYSIHNLFNKYVCGEQIDDWTIVNQALGCESDIARMISRLSEAIQTATGPTTFQTGERAAA